MDRWFDNNISLNICPYLFPLFRSQPLSYYEKNPFKGVWGIPPYTGVEMEKRVSEMEKLQFCYNLTVEMEYLTREME